MDHEKEMTCKPQQVTTWKDLETLEYNIGPVLFTSSLFIHERKKNTLLYFVYAFLFLTCTDEPNPN